MYISGSDSRIRTAAHAVQLGAAGSVHGRRPGPGADCVARPPLCSCHDQLHPACLAPRLASLVRTLRCLGLTGKLALGKVRLAKWFSTMPPKQKAKIVKDVTQLVLARRTRMCNVLEYKGAFITSSWAPETSTHCEDRHQGRIPSICVPLLRHRHYRVRQRACDTGDHPPLRGGSRSLLWQCTWESRQAVGIELTHHIAGVRAGLVRFGMTLTRCTSYTHENRIFNFQKAYAVCAL
jgi:hypothetical protein